MDFCKGKRKAVTVVDIVLDEFLEEFVLCCCPLVVPKGKCFLDVCLSFLIGDLSTGQLDPSLMSRLNSGQFGWSRRIGSSCDGGQNSEPYANGEFMFCFSASPIEPY